MGGGERGQKERRRDCFRVRLRKILLSGERDGRVGAEGEGRWGYTRVHLKIVCCRVLQCIECVGERGGRKGHH